MSDRMVVMNDGKIEEMGDADSIYNHPKTKYTQQLINAIPKGELEDIRASISRKNKSGSKLICYSQKYPITIQLLTGKVLHRNF